MLPTGRKILRCSLKIHGSIFLCAASTRDTQNEVPALMRKPKAKTAAFLIAMMGILSSLVPPTFGEAKAAPLPIDVTTLRGKVMCGYQGWFRAPGDAANLGWVHWSREQKRIAPETLAFEMWPDVRELGTQEIYAAPDFTHSDGRQAYLFISDNAVTVQRHFEWMRDYGIDGAWLQRFAVGLPKAPEAAQY
jgi:hypothetical protein